MWYDWYENQRPHICDKNNKQTKMNKAEVSNQGPHDFLQEHEGFRECLNAYFKASVL